MANPDTIVGQINRIDPPLGTRPAAPVGRTVYFSDSRTARLDPGYPHALDYSELLDDMRQAGIPVYVEVDPKTRAITQVRVPLVGTVSTIVRNGSGQLLIELEISSARHTLSPTNPDFNHLLAVLEKARKHHTRVILIETDDHEIIDVRPFSIAHRSG